ncbi:MAG: hypothetical protein JWR02_582 [Mucilaginibacter sp.]|nr:hypothetical protein [Mucilaginibacter sp.]
MLYKNILCLYLLLVAPATYILPRQLSHAADGRKWIVSENSSLCVNGSTNVNKFACDILAYERTDTIKVSQGKSQMILSGGIGINIQSFNCHNSMMTRDLRKTLKEKQFPMLHIAFLTLNKLPELTSQPEPITGMVEIEIAGVRKQFDVKYKISVDDQKVIHLLGSRDVNFSDFNLIPPKKLGGMIQTKDKLSVDFHLKIKSINR